MRKYNKFFENKIKIISKSKKVLDVGGGNPFQKSMKKYESYFKNCTYHTIDYNEYYNPTYVGNIQNMKEIKNNSYEAIICLSVLEHVEEPLKVVSEIKRILKKGGSGLFFVPSLYPYHARTGKGAYPDNYRYFKDGIKFMFKEFEKVEIVNAGSYFEVLLHLMPFPGKIKNFLEPIAYFFDSLLKTDKKSVARGYYFYVEK